MADHDRCVHDMLSGTCSLCMGLEDPIKPEPPRVAWAAELFDYAASHPVWTKWSAAEELHWPVSRVDLAVRELRQILGNDERINLVCNPVGAGEWVYELVGTLDEALPWASTRLRSVESQLNTIQSVMQSIVAGTSSTSRDGKRARVIAAQINVLQLQLETM